MQFEINIDAFNMQRRESSYRRAKSRAADITHNLTRGDINEQEEPAEFAGDSDEDPAWTPQEDRVPEEEDYYGNKQKRKRGGGYGGGRGRGRGRGTGRSNILSGIFL